MLCCVFSFYFTYDFTICLFSYFFACNMFLIFKVVTALSLEKFYNIVADLDGNVWSFIYLVFEFFFSKVNVF
jgi:hypothetical protein